MQTQATSPLLLSGIAGNFANHPPDTGRFGFVVEQALHSMLSSDKVSRKDVHWTLELLRQHPLTRRFTKFPPDQGIHSKMTSLSVVHPLAPGKIGVITFCELFADGRIWARFGLANSITALVPHSICWTDIRLDGNLDEVLHEAMQTFWEAVMGVDAAIDPSSNLDLARRLGLDRTAHDTPT